MKIIQAPHELKADRKVCLAIGVFDGVHLGHQQIIRQTIADARQHDALAVVVTFDRHPNAIVAPEREPGLIYSLPQKLRTLASLGADAALVFRFDQAFSRQTGTDFIQMLARDLGRIHSICVGANFVFGHKGSGNVDLLKTLGRQWQFTVHGLAAVALDSQVVSSTRIRDEIRLGNLDAASQMLGRPYAICGPIVQGDRWGRQLGFPTANVNAEGLVLPPLGVYSGQTRVANQIYRLALNIGRRPTLASVAPVLRVEAHLLDFEGDLYGQELEIEVGDRLRDEKKFTDKAQLSEQIARDIAMVREKANPMVHSTDIKPVNALRFLIKPDGGHTFWKLRLCLNFLKRRLQFLLRRSSGVRSPLVSPKVNTVEHLFRQRFRRAESSIFL